MEKYIFDSIEEFKKANYTRIEISGGDPLEYRKLPQLIKTLRENGFQWIRISTNGVRLSNDTFVTKLLKYKVDVFRIPLYGSNERVHDCVTRTKGSFNHTLKGIKNLKKIKGIKVLLTSLLLKQNAHNLTQLFDLMHAMGCNDLYFAPVFISNGDFSYYIPYKMQGYFFRKLLKHAFKTHQSIRLMDVPYCVIGFDNDFTENTQKPAHLGSRFEPSLCQRTKIPNVPRYRLKAKIKICRECSLAYKCAGFLVNDILRFGIGNIKPIS
jgi:MoaA/NifB/PqqE/SkfB family radical SAM enzyme